MSDAAPRAGEREDATPWKPCATCTGAGRHLCEQDKTCWGEHPAAPSLASGERAPDAMRCPDCGAHLRHVGGEDWACSRCKDPQTASGQKYWRVVGDSAAQRELASLRAQVSSLTSESARLSSELSEVSAAIGTCEYMDPPDGGDVSLGEQVRRMRAEGAQLRVDADKLRALWGESHAEAARLREALEEAQKDVERMGWLERNSFYGTVVVELKLGHGTTIKLNRAEIDRARARTALASLPIPETKRDA